MENHDLFLVLCPGADAAHGQKVQELLAKHGRCAQMLEQSWLLAVDPERVDSGESDADAIIEELADSFGDEVRVAVVYVDNIAAYHIEAGAEALLDDMFEGDTDGDEEE